MISLDPRLEQQMLEAQRPTEAGTILALDPETGQAVLGRLDTLVREAENTDVQPVLVCAPADPLGAAAPAAAQHAEPAGAVLHRADRQREGALGRGRHR